MSYDILPVEWSAEIRIKEARREAQRERWVRRARHRKDKHRATRPLLAMVFAPARG
jgi:hypothetical protein